MQVRTSRRNNQILSGTRAKIFLLGCKRLKSVKTQGTSRLRFHRSKVSRSTDVTASTFYCDNMRESARFFRQSLPGRIDVANVRWVRTSARYHAMQVATCTHTVPNTHYNRHTNRHTDTDTKTNGKELQIRTPAHSRKRQSFKGAHASPL